MADVRQLEASASDVSLTVPKRAADADSMARRLRQFWRLKGMVIGTLIVFFVIVLAIAAPLIAPQNPYVGRTIDRLLSPVWMADAARLRGEGGLTRRRAVRDRKSVV